MCSKRWYFMILKESPDAVFIDGVARGWSDRDAVCFSMINGICVYQPYSNRPASHDFLIAALYHIFTGGEKAINEVEADGVIVRGVVNESNKQKLQPLFNSILSGKGGFNRNTAMKVAPDLIHGRLWTKAPKVVSFWNTMNIVTSIRSEVLDFIKNFDDPKNFVYDTDKGQLSYSNFLGRDDTPQNPADSSSAEFQKFDPATVHSMPPSPLKSFIQKEKMSGARFGSSSPSYPTAQNRAKMSTSENFSFAEWLKNKPTHFSR